MSTVEEHSSEQIELRTSKPRAVLKADFFLSFLLSFFLELYISICLFLLGAQISCSKFKAPRSELQNRLQHAPKLDPKTPKNLV